MITELNTTNKQIHIPGTQESLLRYILMSLHASDATSLPSMKRKLSWQRGHTGLANNGKKWGLNIPFRNTCTLPVYQKTTTRLTLITNATTLILHHFVNYYIHGIQQCNVTDLTAQLYNREYRI